MTWSLEQLLSELHADIQQRLARARSTIGHAPSKGDASEAVWLEMLKTYLPARYNADTAFVVDSDGKFSEQIDVVVYDRQYSPFIFKFQEQKVIPAESVYAVFEAKQSINSRMITYAQDKAASVRRLHRTSLPIPHAGGVFPPKPLPHIMAGLLALESDWQPAFGQPMAEALYRGDAIGRLDLGCVAAHGHYTFDTAGGYQFTTEGRPATAFLFELIARLQSSATVPMIDIRAYSRWLTGKPDESSTAE